MYQKLVSEENFLRHELLHMSLLQIIVIYTIVDF